MGAGSRLNPFSRDAINPLAPEVRDHLGKILGTGDQVLISKPWLLARVTEITPLPDPGAPPNLMKVRLVAVVDAVIPRQAAMEDVFLTSRAAELVPPGTGAGDPPVKDTVGAGDPPYSPNQGAGDPAARLLE